MKTIEFNEKVYELKYTLGRIEMIENHRHKSVIDVLNNGKMMLADAKVFVGYALHEVGANAYVTPKVAFDLVEAMISKGMYIELLEKAIEAFVDDCGFLYQMK